MPKLPRLDILIRRSPDSRHNADGVFYRYSRYVNLSDSQEKLYRRLLPSVGPLCREPTRPGYREVSTRRMRYHEVKTVSDNVEYIALIMRPRPVCRFKIA